MIEALTRTLWGVRRAAVEPPCLDCEIVPDPALGCECDRAGTLEDRLARAMDGWSITFKPTAKAPEVAAPIGAHPTSDAAWRAFAAWRTAAGVDFHTATAAEVPPWPSR